MNTLRRYAQLLSVQWRLSLLLSLQYRWDFLVDGVMSVFWTLTSLVPLYLVFQERPVIAGWSYGEALLVVAFFTFLEGVLKGAINPSLSTVVEHIRVGSLDFVLLKPADTQFMVSTARFRPWNAMNLFAALGIFTYAYTQLPQGPSWRGVVQSLFLLIGALGILYSLWILVVAVAFRAIRVDNLKYLFDAIFDVARWPASVFKGLLSWLFTFVIPIALMTTYPAEALLGRMSTLRLGLALGGACLFTGMSRWLWLRSLRLYRSASS